ncbi:MAG: PSD1 and planctomycete cytochrome C domain-containing protein [Planctomycetota bacterium]
MPIRLPVLCLVLSLTPTIEVVRNSTSAQEKLASTQHSLELDSEVLFVRRIAPLLREKCLGCHGADPELIEGSLDVRSLEGMLAGGDSEEPSVVPGKPESSPLFLAAKRDSDLWSDMPPKEAERLTKEQIGWLKNWIETGAGWPEAERQTEIEKEYAETWSVEDGIQVSTSGGLDEAWTNRRYDPDGLWAYQALQVPDIPGGESDEGDASRVIDQLIEQAMPKSMPVATRADRRTLIRRATFDLTGLPPTPEEVEAFVSDASTDRDAFARVVDRLLNSPHYGERMAQHWLDVVRYADSSGFANDFERGNAWRYRDYVVRAFNNDKPYDVFVREQIAGDEIDSGDPEKLIATGFLRMGPWELTGMEVAKVARQRFLDDVTNSVGETFLAHSLQCARCHDHKFDPVPTRDYYSIQAVFATTQMAERTAAFLDSENAEGFQESAYLKKTREAHQKVLQELEEVLLVNAAAWFEEQLSQSDGERKDTIAKVQRQWEQEVKQMQDQGRGGIFNAARSAMRNAKLPEEDYPPKLVGFTPEQFGRQRVANKGLQRMSWEFERYMPYALAVYSGRTQNLVRVSSPLRMPKNHLNKGELEQTAILTGGDPFAASQKVAPGTLSVVDRLVAADVTGEIEGRRTAFADWVASPKNPLTARVLVNRLWLWHFGKAIAGNPNNFGSTGKRPTHPRLLDWLANRLIQQGWSIKSMHRTIMNSEAYCRSSSWKPGASEGDAVGSSQTYEAATQSYAAFAPRRLSAEELRDSMLAATKELNPKLGGIPCRPEINQEVALQPRQVMGTFAAAWTPNPHPQQRNRRSIYVLRLRGLVDPMLEVFNSPAPDFSCEQRDASTVTPQVFSLFNGQNTHSRALALADRVLRETMSDKAALRRCFQLTLSRDPTEVELDEFLAHWSSTEKALPVESPERQAPPLEVLRKAVEENTGEKFAFVEQLYSNADYVSDLQPADVDRHTRALSDICLVLLNSNEFVYVY